MSKRLGSLYRSGRSKQWLKVKNSAAPAVKREGAGNAGIPRAHANGGAKLTTESSG